MRQLSREKVLFSVVLLFIMQISIAAQLDGLSNEQKIDEIAFPYKDTQNKDFATNVPLTTEIPIPTGPVEILNAAHANIFKSWIEPKSSEIYKLTRNYSGFALLNSTYSVHLAKDAKFAWINFTSMIVDISVAISEVLSNKAVLVENLSKSVEHAFDEYKNDSARVEESTKYVYYDAKSPKTFCDVAEAFKQSIEAKHYKPTKATTLATTRKTKTVDDTGTIQKRSVFIGNTQSAALDNLEGDYNDGRFSKL